MLCLTAPLSSLSPGPEPEPVVDRAAFVGPPRAGGPHPSLVQRPGVGPTLTSPESREAT